SRSPCWRSASCARATGSGGARRIGRVDVLAYLLRRLAFGALTVLGVLLLLFALFFLIATPDDIARKALGDKAMPEAIAQWKANHGYDKPRAWNSDDPFDTMLAEHLRRMLTFDFGRSDADDTPISDRLRRG